jgi:ubiquitin-protein ligase
MNISSELVLEQKFRSAIQPTLSTWEQFKNSIYSELRVLQYNLQVQIALKTGKSQMLLQPSEIPLFKIIASPTSKDWGARLKEELEKLEYLRINCPDQIIFKDIRLNPMNSRIFNIKSEFLFEEKIQRNSFEIRLPLRYPYEPPIADNFGWLHYIQPAGDHRNACLGKIRERWNNSGYMGVAHFLLLLSYYTALALFTRKLE